MPCLVWAIMDIEPYIRCGERILLNNYSLVELILRFDLVMYSNFQDFAAACRAWFGCVLY